MRTSNFHATFFPYCIEEWNQLNDDFKKIESIKKLKKTLIKVIKTKKILFMEFIIFILSKLLTPLRLIFSHLNDQLLTVLSYGPEDCQ